MKEIISLVEKAVEGSSKAKALGEAVVTGADPLEELRGNIKEAVDGPFDGKTPTLLHLHIVKDELIIL